MKKIYMNASDKFVAAREVYADAKDGHLFSDETKKVKLKKDEVKELFMKGVIVKLDNAYFRLTHIKESGSGVVVASYDGTEAYTFKSEEVE